jgi:uncharacterized membrane protein
MHYFETWGNSWHFFPGFMFMIMILIMAVCIFIFCRRGFIFNRRWFRQNWGRDWFTNCYREKIEESASDLLKKRYVLGEINKEEFEQMKRDISDTN